MAKDPYKLLGVSRKASDAEIRKAYRALAKKLHPDVNPGDKAAETRFKEVTAAYNLLSDKALRARYDSGQVDASGQQQHPFGSGGFGSGSFRQGGYRRRTAGPGGSDDMADLFSSLFGMNMGAMNPNHGGYGRGRAQARPQKGADIRYKLNLTFMEALKGGQKKVKMADGKFLNIKIPVAVEDGAVLRLKGKGQNGVNGGPSGDAKVDVSVGEHKYFSREGKILHLTLPISLREAVMGGKIMVPTPNGSIQLNLPAGTNSGQKLRLKGKGIQGGDLLVTTQIMLKNPNDEVLKNWAKAQDSCEEANIREKIY